MIRITTRSSSRASAIDRRRQSILRLELAVASLLALATACSTFEGLTLTKSSAAGDAGSTKQRCGHAAVQPPSPLASIPGDHEFVVAVRSVDFGEPGVDRTVLDTPSIGFDLDGKCTGEGEGPSCRRPPWADNHPDGPDGRDNAVASLIAKEDGGSPAANGNNVLFSLGLSTMVLRVRGYNGTPVDGNVEVALFAATRSPDPLNSVSNRPLWAGNDVWKAFVEWTELVDDRDGGTLHGPVIAKYQSDRAYVSSGILVAHLDFARGAISYNFSNVWIQARVEDSGGADDKRSLRGGIFAGRVRIDDSLSATEFVSDPDTGQQTCTDSPSYPAAKKRACSLADIGYSGDDPSAACDAASWAWRFEAEPALLSDEVDPTRERDLRKCPSAISPANDHCSTLEGSAR